MAVPRFYVGEAGGPVGATGSERALPDSAAHHALRVLRLAVGDDVTLFDGSGGEWACTLVHADRQHARVLVGRFDPVERELALEVTLALAVIASDPKDSAVRKAVELGVAAITPLTCARTQGTLRGEKAARRLVHWQQIAVAACDQCGRNRVPVVTPVADYMDWIDAQGTHTAVLAPGAMRMLASWIAARATGGDARAPVTLGAGPEGGYTPAELEAADARGVVRVGLGTRVLRAETAALAALATVAAVAGDR
jgi:16S rRNA (uracil1498-N3)-methyltransferase